MKVFCLAVVVLCFLCGMAWAVSICGSCGYENGDEARFCSHCGGKVGEIMQNDERGTMKQGEGEEESGEESESEAGQPEGVPVQSVKAEMRTAQKYAKQGKFELARLFARNAFALNMLAGEDAENVRSKAILKFLNLCELKSHSGRRGCPECKGSGKAVLTANTLGDRSVRMETAGMRCKHCGGSGRISGKLSMDERKYRKGTALEEYRRLQNSRGMLPEGPAWVPAASVSGLGLMEKVILKRSLPPVCSRCMGVGRQDCSACRGRGIVKCRAKDCVNGYVESDSNVNRLGGLGVRSAHVGIGAKCNECSGSGLQSCEKCSGSGSFLCKSCNGSGRADICDKCSGKGLNQCRRCGGSGIYRDKACSYCQEMGSIECSSCGGTGRR